jgi:hypothetical protein
LATNRSSVVGLTNLYKEVENAKRVFHQKLAAIANKRDVMLSGVLEGILFRLNPLVQGSAVLQFAPSLRIPSDLLSKSLKISRSPGAQTAFHSTANEIDQRISLASICLWGL